MTFGGQLGTAAAQLDSLTVNEGAKVTFNQPVYLSGTLRLKTGTTIALGDGLTTRSDATQPFVTVGDYAFEGGLYGGEQGQIDFAAVLYQRNAEGVQCA